MQADGQIVAEIDGYLSDFEQKVSRVLGSYRSPADFTPSSTTHDVYVVTWMKSGTTLCQNITYQLMAAAGQVPSDKDGSLFRDISEVVPFIEAAPAVKVYEPIHEYSPRIWKSHAAATEFVNMTKFANGRFIYLFREGKSVARSFLDFTMGWILEDFDSDDHVRKKCMYERYFLKYFLGLEESKQDGEKTKWVRRKDGGGSGWFQHIKTWIDCELPNVLFVPYEDLVKDMNGWIRVIATYMGLEEQITDDVVQRVMERCDQNTMAGDSRFKDIMISEAFGFGRTAGRRVRAAGEKGYSQYEISEQCVKLYDEMFSEVTGYEDYAQLKKDLCLRNESLKKRFGLPDLV